MTTEPDPMEAIESDPEDPQDIPDPDTDLNNAFVLADDTSDLVETIENVQDELPAEEAKSPALTINIASWATPIVGLVMLVVGLAGGFFLRPVVLPSDAATPASAEDVSSASTGAQQTSQQTPQAQQPSAADRQALMDALVPQVRHFKGDAGAPITVIEFSDFQ